MAFSRSNKIANLQNIGSKTASPEQRGVISSIVFTPETVEFATSTEPTLQVNWDSILKQVNNRAYKLPLNREGESLNEEDTYFEYPTSGGSTKTKDGKVMLRIKVDVPYKVMKALYSFDGVEGRVFINYQKNFIHGASEDGTKFMGLRARLYVENANFNMDGTPEMVPIRVEFLDSRIDFWNNAEYVEPSDFAVEDLDSLTDIELTEVGASSAAAIVISTVNDINGVGITGLVLADFSITGTGTLSSLTDNGDGTYTFVTVGLINGDIIDLVTAPNISIDGYYESKGTLTVAGVV